MSNTEGHEIVIIRRKIDDGDEEHHGGVWKIAFADFMTAMMAFFLVMWLISASEKTRVTIARYFNPIKFSEQTPNRKGLLDPKDTLNGAPAKGDNPVDDSTAPPPAEQMPVDQKPVDQKQSSDAKPPPPPSSSNTTAVSQNGPLKGPNSTLLQKSGGLAAQPSPSPSPARAPTTETASAARREVSAGDFFRDPFAPSGQEITGQSASPSALTLQPSVSHSQPSVSAANLTSQPNIVKTPLPESTNPAQHPIGKQADQTSPQSAVQAGQIEANKLHADISNALKDDVASQPGPGIEVRETNEGTLISLMDETGFEMFSVGSARPQARVAGMMEKVAKILKAHGGSVVIRGHTDGRVYKSATYNNWRLSADRADMARDMLVNGGLDENRIQRIEGLADRELKVPGDPNAAENRRIEILVKDDKP